MSEIWKDVVGYEGVYEVSNMGRVKSLRREYTYINRHGTETTATLSEKIMSLRPHDCGYKLIMLYKDRVGKSLRVHRLVAEAFIDKPHGRDHVNHKNGVRDDNSVENLEWVTRSENMTHASEVLGHRGERKPMSKLRDADIVDIRSLLGWGVGQKDIAKLYSVSKVTICDIHLGRTWAHAA